MTVTRTTDRVEGRVRLAWSMWVVAVGSALVGIALAWRNGWPFGLDPWGFQVSVAVIVGSLGLVVASRRPENSVGWLMLVIAVLDGLASFGLQYGMYGVVTSPGSVVAPDLVVALTYGSSIGIVFGLTITFFLLLFPDGKLPSPRWLPVAAVAAVGILLMSTGLTWHVIDTRMAGLLDALGSAEGLPVVGTASTLNEIGHVLVFLVFPLAVASLFIRRRRADTTERAQLRWFLYGAVVFLSSIFAPLPEPFAVWLEIAATTFLFVAIGIAIVRYRLYEIDRIVSRTVSYGVLTALLAGVYYGSVFLLRDLLPFEGPVPIAASTLAGAALFLPARRRIQEAVDRRFNRSRYDTARVVEGFAQHLRDEVDLDRLGEELRMVIAQTMQPRTVALWVPERAET